MLECGPAQRAMGRTCPISGGHDRPFEQPATSPGDRRLPLVPLPGTGAGVSRRAPPGAAAGGTGPGAAPGRSAGRGDWRDGCPQQRLLRELPGCAGCAGPGAHGVAAVRHRSGRIPVTRAAARPGPGHGQRAVFQRTAADDRRAPRHHRVRGAADAADGGHARLGGHGDRPRQHHAGQRLFRRRWTSRRGWRQPPAAEPPRVRVGRNRADQLPAARHRLRTAGARRR